MPRYSARHARPSPWRWLATFPPAAGLVLTCLLASWPAAASAAASAAPMTMFSALTESRVQVQAAPGLPVRQVDAATTATVLTRREAAQDSRQEARLDAQQAAAALAAQQAAARAARRARRATASPAPASVPSPSSPTPAGDLSFGQLEALWVSAGGPASQESEAATVAECESGGNPNAYNPSGASGLWQILGQVVGGNIFDPMVNAENAVAKYNAAGGWSPWVCAA